MTKQSKIQRGRKAPVISVRLTPEEHADIKEAAKGQSLSRYVRHELFVRRSSKRGTDNVPVNTKAERRLSESERQKYLAQALSKLGKSDLHQSMKIIADATRLGVLPLTPDVTADIRAATDYIADIRQALLRGLGLRSGGTDDLER